MSEADQMIAAIEQAFGGKFNEPIPTEIMAKALRLLSVALNAPGKEAAEDIACALLVERKAAEKRGRAEGLEEALKFHLNAQQKLSGSITENMSDGRFHLISIQIDVHESSAEAIRALKEKT